MSLESKAKTLKELQIEIFAKKICNEYLSQKYVPLEEAQKNTQKLDEAWFIKYNVLKETLEREAKTQETLRKDAYEIRNGFIKANQRLAEELEELKKKADYYEAHYNINYETWLRQTTLVIKVNKFLNDIPAFLLENEDAQLWFEKMKVVLQELTIVSNKGEM